MKPIVFVFFDSRTMGGWFGGKLALRRKKVYKREHERGISLGEGGEGDVGILSSERGGSVWVAEAWRRE